jgi:hypothetical protein
MNLARFVRNQLDFSKFAASGGAGIGFAVLMKE